MKRFVEVLTVPMITLALAGVGFADGHPGASYSSGLQTSQQSDTAQDSSLARGTEAGFIVKERVAGTTDYCHMKFPAIQESTLSSRNPVLEPRTSGDVIDMYGPCNYDPDGRLAVSDQKRDMQHRFEREFHDG